MNDSITRLWWTLPAIAGLLIIAAAPSLAEKARASQHKNHSFCNEVDESVKPGDDFYQHENASWMKSHPIPPDKGAYGSYDEVRDRTNQQLRTIAEDAAKNSNAAPGSPEQKLRDFYRTAMNVGALQREGADPLRDLLGRIDNLKTMPDIQTLAAYFQTVGIDAFFSIYSEPDPRDSSKIITRIWQGGLALPGRDYYTKTDRKSVELRREYVGHIKRMLMLLGEEPAVALAHSARILEIETALAKASFTNVQNRDVLKTTNVLSIKELEKLMPNFDWAGYFAVLGYPNIAEVNVAERDFMSKLDRVLTEVSPEDWKIFLRWKLINKTAMYLSAPFEEEHFAFFRKRLEGQQEMKPRWERVLRSMNFKMGHLLGEIYVKKYFPPEAKKRMESLVLNLKRAFHEIILGLTWMTPVTKAKAQEKLNAMQLKIGYPDKWEDYSKLDVRRDSYVQNMLRLNNFFFRYGPAGMEYAGRPADRSRWLIPPQIVNAMYDPAKNEIVFPAGILQPPFFDMEADNAINYGGIGSVIGHEMTHGFDDQGRLYDKDGNLNNWWSAHDEEEFRKRTEILVDQFNHFEVLPGVFINGELTLGENIADLGGVNIAYYAYMLALMENEERGSDECFNAQQRFFLSYARIWRQNIRDEELGKQVMTDPHSPNRFRVDGPLFDIGVFYAAFPMIKPGDRLYRPKDVRAVIWGVDER